MAIPRRCQPLRVQDHWRRGVDVAVKAVKVCHDFWPRHDVRIHYRKWYQSYLVRHRRETASFARITELFLRVLAALSLAAVAPFEHSKGAHCAIATRAHLATQ